MPSWNIHIAHAEGLLAECGPLASAVRDRNAFLFGSLVPDIYVGYMVPCVVHPIPYRVTHFAAPEHIPKPREGEFWDMYVAPMARQLGISIDEPAARGLCTGDEAGSLAREVAHVAPAHAPTYDLTFDPAQSARFQREAFESAKAGVVLDDDDDVSTAPSSGGTSSGPYASELSRSLFDLVLGTWAHLLADIIWNRRVSDFLDVLGEKPSRDFRIKKQSDFDQFGKSLAIDSFPVPTPRLIDLAARFPQYAIDERSVCFTCAIAHEIVRTNSLSVPPAYRLLTEEFFTATFADVQSEAECLMRTRLAPCAAAPELCGRRQDS